VNHVVEVEKPVPVARPVEVPMRITGAAWSPALVELARQIDAGRVYDRDLTDLAETLSEVLQALDRRPAWRRRRI
jgi:hypothetical protein